MSVVRPDTAFPRLASIDGVRGILAVFVLLGHLNIFTGGLLGESVVLALGFRVPAFFALSGFVLYLSSASRERVELNVPFWQFVGKRLRRLLPAYYAALLLCLGGMTLPVLADLPSAAHVHHPTASAILANLLMLQSWNQRHWCCIDPPCWMMGYEWLLSLLLPLILSIVRRYGWVVLLSGCLLMVTPPAMRIISHLLPPGLTISFFMGVMAARLARRVKEDRYVFQQISLRIVVLLTILLAGGIHLWIQEKTPCLTVLVQGTAGIMTAALCLYLAYKPSSVLSDILSVRPLQLLGRISYSLFLIHFPLLSFVCWMANHWHLQGSSAFYQAYLPAVPLIIGAAYLFFRLFEEPFQTSRHS